MRSPFSSVILTVLTHTLLIPVVCLLQAEHRQTPAAISPTSSITTTKSAQSASTSREEEEEEELRNFSNAVHEISPRERLAVITAGRTQVVAGALLGLGFGAFVGLVGATTLDYNVNKVAGGFGLLGMLFGFLGCSAFQGVSRNVLSDIGMDMSQIHGLPTEQVEPSGDKMLASAIEALAAMNAYKDAMDVGNVSMDPTFQVAYDNVKGVYDALASGWPPSPELEEKLQEARSHPAVNSASTAEAAAANGELLTASDLASIAGGSRGEESATEGAFQGDMIPADDQQLRLFRGHVKNYFGSGIGGPYVSVGRPWTGAVVQYCIAPDVPPAMKAVFLAAADQVSRAVTCIEFKDVGWLSGSSTSPQASQLCKAAPAIFVQSNPAYGCFSYVGMLDWPTQRLQLNSKSCSSVGTAVHEIGHALGNAHTQSRPDRDKYVTIMWNNIDPGMQMNFDINPDAFTGLPYDYLSVMHYDAYAFATNPNFVSILAGNAEAARQMGQRVGLSMFDGLQLTAMYRPEVPTCSAKKRVGMGCVDKPDATGANICKGITQCTSATLPLCCACGGGMNVQCYEGEPCPTMPQIPVEQVGYCLQDVTSKFPGQKCVVTNTCNFAVTWICSLGCTYNSNPGSYNQFSCSAQPEEEICMPKPQCRFGKT